LTPGELNDDPFLALANSIKLLSHNQSYEVRKIHDELIITGDISSLVQTILAKQSSGSELLIFIDQFEELFTLVADEYRKPFTILLNKMAETEHLRTVITLRADFYHRCFDYSHLPELLRAGSFPRVLPI
jgi:conflict system STAND superfamily ATPase